MIAEINPRTVIARAEDLSISIEVLPNLTQEGGFSLNISDFSGTVNGVHIDHGSLVAGNNGFDGVYASIDSNGNLIVSGSASVLDYSIDGDGFLIVS